MDLKTKFKRSAICVDITIPFLDTSVSRDSNGLLTTTVYRKPTHTDQYLAYDSHHPQSVKRGIVKCLYDRAKHLTPKPSAISKEKTLLSSALVSNGYPSSFVRKLTKTTRPTANKLNKTVSSIKFHVSAGKYTSGRQGERCKTG